MASFLKTQYLKTFNIEKVLKIYLCIKKIEESLKLSFCFKVSLDVNNIAECEITDEKPGGRALFRIYFKKSHDFKHYEFEATRHTASKSSRFLFIYKNIRL